MARLPAQRDWRIGHFGRDIPAGYLDSVLHKDNQIQDPATAALYNDIRLVTQSENLFTRDRWSAIIRLNLM